MTHERVIQSRQLRRGDEPRLPLGSRSAMRPEAKIHQKLVTSHNTKHKNKHLRRETGRFPRLQLLGLVGRLPNDRAVGRMMIVPVGAPLIKGPTTPEDIPRVGAEVDAETLASLSIPDHKGKPSTGRKTFRWLLHHDSSNGKNRTDTTLPSHRGG